MKAKSLIRLCNHGYGQDRGRFTYALSVNAARKLHAINKKKSFVNLLLSHEHQQFKNSFVLANIKETFV